MSHFSTLVIGEDYEHQLAPFHEFECTGREDEFVIVIDTTEEYFKDYNSDSQRCLVGPDGVFSKYDDKFYRYPTEEEKKLVGLGSGCGNGLSWSSRDWNDGRGYQTKVSYIPEGYEEKEIPFTERMTFEEYLVEWHSLEENGDKYSWYEKNGEEIKTFRRTNPNSKWDWYTVGGRWSDFFLLKDGSRADQAKKGDIDWELMTVGAGIEAGEEYDKIRPIIDENPPFETWESLEHLEIEERREFYNNQPTIRAFREKSIFDNVENYLISREEYVKNAENSAGVTFAVVKNRQWFQRGKMGWWGAVSGEKDRNEWNEEFQKMISELPDNEVLTLVDCHI